MFMTSACRARRRLVFAAAGMAFAPFNGIAQGLSDRPVHIIVATTPGTTPDVLARILAPRLQTEWNQPFVVENRAGAGGMIGMEAVAKAAPDGHTINVYLSSALTLPFFFPVSFDVLTSFSPIGMVAASIMALVVHSSVPAKNVGEFIAFAKQRGANLNYGSPGNGTYMHIVMEQLKLRAGFTATHIPYKGFAQATSDLLGGQIQAMFVPVGVAINLAKGGKVRLLGGSGRDRSPLHPDLPSISEQGVTGFDAEVLYAVSGPSGMSPAVIQKYNSELHSILQDAEVQNAFARQHLVVRTSTPEELARINQSEYEKLADIIRKANIKGD